MSSFAVIRLARLYLGSIRAMRDDVSTARFVAGLPRHISKDIGWPDGYDGRLGRGGENGR